MSTPAGARRRWAKRPETGTPNADAGSKDPDASVAGPDGYQMVVELAHELRSPLAAVLTLSETLRCGGAGPITPLQQRRLDLIYGATLGLCATVGDAVEFASGAPARAERCVAPFSVDDMLRAVRDTVFPIAESKGLELELGLPHAGSRTGHERDLSRVLLNLAINAVRHTETGFVEIAATALDDARIEFSVLDSGAGLDLADQRDLYQPFRKTSSRTGYLFSSSGLGLAICRKLVRRMDAELQVETSVGAGSRFSFQLQLPRVDPGG